MTTISLINPNNYIIRNNDVSESITNGFINHNGDLQVIWGYSRVIPTGWNANRDLLATLVTSDGRYLILVDIDGVTVWKIDRNKKLSVYSPKMYFETARWKDDSGQDKYANKRPYRANKKGVSIMQDSTGIIYITDGSIGGLYLMTLIDGKDIFFKQLDYAKITPDPVVGYVPPYQNGYLVEMISPVSLEYYNPHIIVIDNRTNLPEFDTILNGYMYVLDGIKLDKDGNIIYDKTDQDPLPARMTTKFSMTKPIIDAKLLNNILYVIAFDRIEMYRLSEGVLPIEKIQSNALEIGCYSRNLLATFNGKLVFVGQNDNKIPSLFVWIGGERDPTEFNKNNLSYIFSMTDVDLDTLTLSTFATSAQEFVVINSLPINLSVLIDITEKGQFAQNSYFIKEEGGFDADYIFQIGETYYYISRESEFLYQFSPNITTFDDKIIPLEIRSMQYASDDSNKLSVLSNLKIVMQSLPEDFLNLMPSRYAPYLVDENRFTYTIHYKNSRRGWLSLYDGKHLPINPVTLGSSISTVLQTDKRCQMKLIFYPKSYQYNKNWYYSPIIIKQVTIDADSY